MNINGIWSGTYIRDGGSGTLSWTFYAQDGNSITGTVLVVEDMQRDGTLTGTLSGNVLTFTFTFGMNCVRTVSGTATFDTTSASGTFSGQDCNGVRINNGRLSLASQRPSPPALASTTWYTFTNPPTGGPFGFDSWGLRFSQIGPGVGGSAEVSGTMMVGCSASLANCHSEGAFTGTLTYRGAGPNCNACWTLTFAASLSGRCPSMLSGTTNVFGGMAGSISGSLNGSTCTGAVNNVSFLLPRQ